MNAFETYFTDESIIYYLCKHRVKYAQNRSKKHLIHLLTDDPFYNYHKQEALKQSDYEKKFISDLNELIPPRRKWKPIGKPSRFNNSGHKKTSVQKNFDSLVKTIKYFRREHPSEPFVQKLNQFIIDIRLSIRKRSFNITTPTIYPKLKEKVNSKGENKCRPISLFDLRDRIILSITNKYLTELFDPYFDDCSYAFRAKRNVENYKKLSHHDCIKAIQNYQTISKPNLLWVVECDMEKFFDTVNHKRIVKEYRMLMRKAKADSPHLKFSQVTRIFNSYLRCYTFNLNVYPLNKDEQYWLTCNIKDGIFGWVEKELSPYYTNMSNERIGIPQGGALSGLIANIILSVADKRMRKQNVFYIRFCDDMIVLNPTEKECEKAKHIYIKALKNLKLVPHSFPARLIENRLKRVKNLPTTSIEKFWNAKSKGAYLWGRIEDDGYPWIGFVGYELHYDGHIRVRKKSLKKEFDKQKEVVNRIMMAIEKGKRKGIGTISESVIHKLVGMSVGRIDLRNFDKIENEMCWKNGFRELHLNKHSVKQMKQLDRNRSKLFYKLNSILSELPLTEVENIEPVKTRKILEFNKPFSYYYQVLEREYNKKKK